MIPLCVLSGYLVSKKEQHIRVTVTISQLKQQ